MGMQGDGFVRGREGRYHERKGSNHAIGKVYITSEQARGVTCGGVEQVVTRQGLAVIYRFRTGEGGHLRWSRAGGG